MKHTHSHSCFSHLPSGLLQHTTTHCIWGYCWKSFKASAGPEWNHRFRFGYTKVRLHNTMWTMLALSRLPGVGRHLRSMGPYRLWDCLSIMQRHVLRPFSKVIKLSSGGPLEASLSWYLSYRTAFWEGYYKQLQICWLSRSPWRSDFSPRHWGQDVNRVWE